MPASRQSPRLLALRGARSPGALLAALTCPVRKERSCCSRCSSGSASAAAPPTRCRLDHGSNTASIERCVRHVPPPPRLAARCACAGFCASDFVGSSRGAVTTMVVAPFLHIRARTNKSHTVMCAGMQLPACCMSALRRSTFILRASCCRTDDACAECASTSCEIRVQRACYECSGWL